MNTDDAYRAPVIKHSAGGIIVRGGKVLTISWTNKDYVTFPKGGLNEGETSEQAALREVLEETGYKARIIAPIDSWTYDFEERGNQYRKTVDYYAMELIDDAAPTPHREPGEDFENLWLPVDEAMQRLTFDDTRRAFELVLRLSQH